MSKGIRRYIAWLLAVLLCFNNLYLVSAAEPEVVIDTVSGADVLEKELTISSADVVEEGLTVSGADAVEEGLTVSGADAVVEGLTVSGADMLLVKDDDFVEESVSGNETEISNFPGKRGGLSVEQCIAKQELSFVAAELKKLEAGEDYVEHEVVALVENMKEAKEIAECYQGEVIDCEEGVAVLEVGANVESVIAIAASLDNDYPAVYPNYIYYIDEIIDTEALSDDAMVQNQWYHVELGTESAWSITKGEGVLISVIDTGIDTDHPDLIDNIRGTENSVDGTDAEDGNGHGTHVAGVIAAEMDNQIGGTGVAPESSILVVKAIDDNGYGTTASIVRGIYLSLARDAKIINLSVSSYVYDELNQLAVETAVNTGCIVVAAAGNYSTDQKVYPAAYEEVIAVGATDRYGSLSYYSNYGNWVEIAAPGSSIYSTLPDGGYGYKSGTSMSTPMVTATIALILASRPELCEMRNANCLQEVREILQTTRQEKEYIYGERSLYGGIHAGDAVAGKDAMLVVEAPQVEPSAYVPGKKNDIYSGNNHYVELTSNHKNAKIYYTLDGKKPTKKSATLYTGPIVFEKKGNVTIKAIAVVGEHTSKVTTQKYKLVALTEKISPLYGETQTLLKGKSLKLQVGVTPSYASNKNVIWELVERSSNVITFNKSNGTIKCSSKAQGGETAIVRAYAKDGSGAFALIKVVVSAEAIKPELDTSTLVLTSKEDSNNDILAGIKKTHQLVVTPSMRENQYEFSTSNKKVATVDEKGLITAVGKGTAKIKVTLKDGSNKTAICTVKVITPVTTINTLKTSTGYYAGDEEQVVFYGSDYIGEEAISIAKGSKITIKAYLNEDYTWRDKSLKDTNKPTNSKIVWTSDDPTIIKVKNGQVSCTSNAVAGQTVTITATAADGYGASKSITFKVCDKISKIYVEEGGKRYSSGYTKTLEIGENIEDYGKLLSVVSNGKATDNYEVTISNREIAAVFRRERTVSGGKVSIRLVYDENGKAICALKKGNCKITFKARDGSNKKFVVKLKVE